MEPAVYTPLDPTVSTLENGLRIVSEYLPYVHSASIGVWIRAGSGDETPEQAGISHFLEHLLFKGTKNRTARELMDAIESRGGQMNAFTSREYTCLYVRILEQHVPVAIEVLADIVRNSTFNDLDKERNVILEEIASAKDVPDDHVHDLHSEHVWPEHALGRPIAGYEDTVGDTDLDDVVAYYGTWYAPENIVVGIAGKFDETMARAQIERAFGELPAHGLPGRYAPPVFAPGQHLESSDIAQDHIIWGFPSVAITTDRRYRYDLLTSILGGGSTSRLFETIREQAGLAYSVYAYNSMYTGAGAMGFYAAVAAENLERTIELCAGELRRLQDELVPEEEMSSNREQLKGGLMLALENTFNRMSRMVRSLMYFDEIVRVDEILARIDAVTPDDVQRTAQEAFDADHSVLTVLGPVPSGRLPLRI